MLLADADHILGEPRISAEGAAPVIGWARQAAAWQARRVVSFIPGPDTGVPGPVSALAAGRPARAVWRNETGGLTFELGAGADRRFVKWAPAGSGINLSREVRRLRWAAPFTPVPRVLGEGTAPEGSWLVTAALPGRSAVDPRWLEDPRTAVTAIGEGLRALHEALPVASCPFSWAAADRVAMARRRAAAGLLDPAGWDPAHRDLGLDRALELAGDIPPAGRLVVCHGDSCAPNTLLADDGRWSGHVDLGELGVADPWADLAIATWSTQWNYGPGWERLLLDAYGTAADPDRIRYYRLLWDLGDGVTGARAALDAS
jgi:kanamycin kinase